MNVSKILWSETWALWMVKLNNATVDNIKDVYQVIKQKFNLCEMKTWARLKDP